MLTTGIPDVFQSHHEVMDALDQNFAGSDDPQRAMAVNKLREDLTTACQRQEDDAKTAILELSQQVRETQEEATPKEAPEAHQQRVHRLSQLTQESNENVDSLNKATRWLEDKRGACKLASSHLQDRSQQVQELATISEPRARHELSLYAHISRLTWQNSGPGVWRGAVSDSMAIDIRTIDLDSSKLSQFEMINRVWDAIDPPPGKEQILLSDG